MDLDFDGSGGIRWDVGLALVVLDKFPNTIVSDADKGVAGRRVDDNGARDQDKVGGVARMGLFDGLLEIGGEEAVVANDKGGVVTADEDVPGRVNRLQLVK